MCGNDLIKRNKVYEEGRSQVLPAMKGGIFRAILTIYGLVGDVKEIREERMEKEAAECDQNYAGKLKAPFSLFKQVETFCSGHAFFA